MRVRRPPSIVAEIFDVTNSVRLWRVFHESYDLCFIPRRGNDPAGVSHWWYRGRNLESRCGSLMLTEPGEMHVTKRFEAPARHFWFIQIDADVVAAAAAELGAATAHLRDAATTAPRLYRALAVLYDTLENSSDADILEQQIVFASCVRLLIRDCGETHPPAPLPASRAQLQRARDLIHAQFADTIRLEELAHAAGMSRYHLAHEFTRAYGVPPHAYQNALRAAEAMRQLRAGVPPALVDVGFADQSHMTRHFKRAYGLTPGDYAAAVNRFGAFRTPRPPFR